MATSKTTVNGVLATSNDNPITQGTITFTLNKYGLDLGDSEVILPRASSADINSDGTFTVDVWPNADGLELTDYTVKTNTTTGGKQFTSTLGTVQVPAGIGPVTLFELLVAVKVAASTQIEVVATEQEFEAATATEAKFVVLYA